MKNRCNNPEYKSYHGKGIRVSDSWNIFEEFKRDMYPSFLEHVKLHGDGNTTIDRIDNDKGYEQGNCRWATHEIQNANRSTAHERKLPSCKTFMETSFNDGKKVLRVIEKSTNKILKEIIC